MVFVSKLFQGVRCRRAQTSADSSQTSAESFLLKHHLFEYGIDQFLPLSSQSMYLTTCSISDTGRQRHHFSRLATILSRQIRKGALTLRPHFEIEVHTIKDRHAIVNGCAECQKNVDNNSAMTIILCSKQFAVKQTLDNCGHDAAAMYSVVQ